MDRVITPNYPLTPVSTYGGPIYELKIEVSQMISVFYVIKRLDFSQYSFTKYEPERVVMIASIVVVHVAAGHSDWELAASHS